MASELGDIQLIGADSEFFIAELTGTTSGRILTKYVVYIVPYCTIMIIFLVQRII